MATIVPELSSIPTTIPNSSYRPGNGLCIFFWDADEEFYPGGIGSSLGYTNYVGPLAYRSTTITPNSAFVNGVKGGYVGVGFDVKGDFSTTDNGKVGFNTVKDAGVSSPSTFDTKEVGTNNPNTICVRTRDVSGYSIHSVSPNLSTFPLASDPHHERYFGSPAITLHQTVSSRDDITFTSVKVTLQNNGQRVKAEIKGSDGVWYPYHVADLNYSLSDITTPDKLRAGISFATSHDFVNCDIKNVSIYADHVPLLKSQTKLAPTSGISISARKI
tara:strand:- start:6692 stop:7510 length:819 start_codon:yes stop_codon:yes gene_type:complete